MVVIVVATSGGGSGGDDNGNAQKAKVSKAGPEGRRSGAYWIVQSGDTLSAIAHKTGVDVATLQALNPDVDPQILIGPADSVALTVRGIDGRRGAGVVRVVRRARHRGSRRRGGRGSGGGAATDGAKPPARPPLRGSKRKAWILIDARDDAVLASKSPDKRLPIASTTKLMTAYVALKHLKPTR